MATPITILGFRITKAARDLKLNTYTIPVVVLAGITRVVNLPTEFMALGVSVSVQNLDGANVATLIINNDRINPIPIVNGSPVNIGTQWLVQVEIIPGGGANTTLLFEVVNLEDA